MRTHASTRLSGDQLTLVRRALTAVLAIAALLLGLVAMHAMHAAPAAAETGMTNTHVHENATAGTDDGVSEAVAMHAPVATAITSTSAQRCGGMCEMNCLLMGMVCAVSILAAVIGLLLIRRPSPPRFSVAKLVRILRVAAEHITVPTPPSLDVLSISRT
ncbi:hypothetical protein [Glaciihabitans sp. UYNi722]|uniref:hypothetical protein n=1 Tax=Glaciihabitans sp. UYNi722 TaxID=3156344 RepID=UPI0033958F87